MVKQSNANFFKYRKDCLFTLLIDRSGATSGELMKSLAFRAPELVEKVKARCKNNEILLGNCFIIDHYLFIVARDSYHSKYYETTLRSIMRWLVPQLNKQKKFKSIVFDTEDYPELLTVLQQAAAELTDMDAIFTTNSTWNDWASYDVEE